METSGALMVGGIEVPADVADALSVVTDYLGSAVASAGLGSRVRQRESALVVAEVARRQLEASTARLIAAARRDGDYLDDGHRDVRPWVNATINTSRSEALHEVRVARLGDAHPVVLDRLSAGVLGVQQARALAATFANPRITEAFAESLPDLLDIALRDPYDLFLDRLRAWEHLVDADGSHCDADAAHAGRHAHVGTVGDTTYLDASFGNYQGAEITEILDRFADAEYRAEWEQGTLRHGEDMNTSLLERTHAQRRADALVAIFRRAAGAPPGIREPEPVVNIVIPQHTFEEQLAAMLEDRPPVFDVADPTGQWCATTSGLPVDAAVAVSAALVGHVRRVVISSADVVIGFGSRQRCFTGASRQAMAVQFLLQTGGRCIWPACGRRHLQIDHAVPHSEGGPTDPGNASPACGHHNVVKNRGFTTWRDESGRWHITRPDGSEISPA